MEEEEFDFANIRQVLDNFYHNDDSDNNLSSSLISNSFEKKTKNRFGSNKRN
jgi:hypothetical protein